ncbi:hypothetical protein EHQ05_19345 [Leptospira yasudae]|uniref:hypothetical protein n=1 Tax=Leptospira yasudae TaxID=2202201 RepID=UPI001083FFE0|nr:hypothetical protein [Leptospira yasudae]TGK23338.1 hypothetical protein EHQ05_19345 [Leptospira yasudae]TGM09770.1 hypothetical protein EHQ86_00160 [Leptospira yasudae]
MKLIEKIKVTIKSRKILNRVAQGALIIIEYLLKGFVLLFEPMKNIGLILLGAVATIAYLHYSGYLNSITDKIVPAEPRIVSFSCDDNSTNLGNLEYSMRVVANVRNVGGSGNVVIEADGYQGQDKWTKSEMIYMSPQQTSNVIITFDEVSLFGGGSRCSVRAFAYSK